MPTRAMASHYWPGDGEEEPAPPSAEGYIYPYWFDPTIVGFWGLEGWKLPVPRKRFWWEWYTKRVRGWVLKKYRQLPLRFHATVQALRLIWRSEFRIATTVVQSVARDPKTRNMKYWGEIPRLIVSNKVVGENIYRGMAATSRLTPLTPELDRTEREVMIELAWAALKVRH